MNARHLIKIALWLLAVSGTIFLFWMSSTFAKFRYESSKYPSNYALLSEAFLKRQLHFDVAADQELLENPDPYNPKSRRYASYIWDASWYNQKYFLYFGPTPALILYAPSLVLFHHPLIDDVAIIMLTILAIIALGATCLCTSHRLLHLSPPGGLLPWFLYIAFGSSLSLQLGGGMYVVAALSGMLFQLLTLFFLIRCLTAQKPKRRHALLAGLAALAAIGSRPTHMLVALFGGLLLCISALAVKDSKITLRTIATFALPLFLGGALLAWYNYARFDNIFEFGLSYQLGLDDFTKKPLCALQNVLNQPRLLSVQAWYLLLQPPYLVAQFPYLSFKRFSPRQLIDDPELTYLGADAVTGLFAVSPLLIPGLIATLIYWRAFPKPAQLFFGTCLAIGICILAYLHTCIFAAARYLFEAISVLSVVSLPSLWFACGFSSRAWVRWFWSAVVTFGLVIGVAIGLAGVLDGHFKKGPAIRALLNGKDRAKGYDSWPSSKKTPS